MPRIDCDRFVGSTKTQVCVSSGWPIGLSASLPVADSRCSVPAAVV